MPLLCEGEIITINLKDSLKALTEEEYIILDTLIEKVQDYSNNKTQISEDNRIAQQIGFEYLLEEMKK